MGLLKAGLGALSGVLADEWRDYFVCEAMDADTLVTKGTKKAGKRSSNTKSDENIITNGSIIAIHEGQCMILVSQGKVTELCAEPGEFVYDNASSPSIFYGGLGKGILESFKEIGKRFTFGGGVADDERVYFVNTKEIPSNKYGTPSPVPFRVVDANVGLDVDIAIRCHGEYSYKITDPIRFYTNVCGNVTNDYSRENIDGQLKTELLTVLQPAFAKISAMGIRYSALPGHTVELADALNELLSEKWKELRGIEVASFGVSSVKASEEDEDMIKELQRNAAFRNPNMAAAHLVGAQAEAMQSAAKNEGGMGAMGGFFGMNMAKDAGGAHVENLYALGQNTGANTGNNGIEEHTWKCACGKENAGKFCSECGAKRPEKSTWTCACGKENDGKFCSECGAKRPESGTWTCACGAENTGKFCSECGKPRE